MKIKWLSLIILFLLVGIYALACDPNSVPFEPNTICVLYFENGAIVMMPVITVDAPHRWTVTGPHKFYTYPALYELFISDPNTYSPQDFATLAEYWTKPACYTLGGKVHLYADCWRIAGKVVNTCDCESDNVCLTCLSRKIREEIE